MIRLAKPEDAAAILDIYTPYIQHTSLTFETEVPTVDKFGQRIESYLQNWPWLVFETGGKIAGYAYASRYRERAGYQWSVECSVYVRDDFFRKGVARQLYSRLFELLRIQGFTTVYAVINLPNDVSVKFHENMGFRYFATYENVGYKLGKWKNVGWWQLQLNDYIDNPQAPRSFNAVSKEEVEKVLKMQ